MGGDQRPISAARSRKCAELGVWAAAPQVGYLARGHQDLHLEFQKAAETQTQTRGDRRRRRTVGRIKGGGGNSGEPAGAR